MKLSVPNKKDFKPLLIIIPVFIILFSGIYIFSEFLLINMQNKELQSKLELMDKALSISQRNVYMLSNNLAITRNDLQKQVETNTDFQNQIQNITSTVGVLEKLSKTDAELLKKYSKVYFLNENFIPDKLSTIDPSYLLEKDRTMQIHSNVWPYLQNMMNNASSSGVKILIASAYRSFGDQAQLKSEYKVSYGSGANRFSADQGYSEHQLGTTLYFTNPKTGASLVGFDKTDSFKWLQENAYKYGFVMSYPKENTYYIFEPWHWRFVGVALATKIHEMNTYFYALDQREINQYLVNIF